MTSNRVFLITASPYPQDPDKFTWKITKGDNPQEPLFKSWTSCNPLIHELINLQVSPVTSMAYTYISYKRISQP